MDCIFTVVLIAFFLLFGEYTNCTATVDMSTFFKSISMATGGTEERTVPEYMKKLYKQYNSNTFSEVSCILTRDTKTHVHKQQCLTFDLTNIRNVETANLVMLRLFKRRPTPPVTRQLYMVHLYEVLDWKNGTSGEKRIGSRVVGNWRGEWLVFDVTSQVKRNAQIPIKHFLVEIEPFHQTNSSVDEVRIRNWSSKRALLLIFHEKKSQNKKKKIAKDDSFLTGLSRVPRNLPIGGQCSRHPLYIDFDDLGWGKMIIAPRGFSAYYCRGKCSVMFDQSLNPSHHSVVRNLYKIETRNEEIPSPCCVPTELEPITIMYFDESKNIIMKEITDMSVASCGCR